MPEKKKGSNGTKFLRVDLTSDRIWSEQVDEETYRKYLGGTGYGTKVLYEEVPPDLEWSDPENRFIVASGPLGGTRVNGSGTVSVVTKGPMTNGAAASQANSFTALISTDAGKTKDTATISSSAPLFALEMD